MSSSYVVARQEIRAIMKEKTFILLLAIFMVMTLASTYIGWSSHHTIQQVYDSSVQLLQQEGKSVPPPPFESATHLSLVKNMIIYVVMIGALLAITIGYLTGVRDRKAGVTRIIFSRNITRKQFLLGKVMAVLFVLGCMLLVASIISAVSLLVLSDLTFTDVMRIAGFYSFSLVYLIGFALIGLLFALTRKTSTIALLVPVIVWLAITFMIPELTSALYPTASMNPTLPQTDVLQSNVLNTIHTAVYPLSITEHFKAVTEHILMLPQQPGVTRSFDYPFWIGYVSISIWAVVCMVAGFLAMGKFQQSQGELNE